MFCDFRKAFGLDPEHNKQLEESMQEDQHRNNKDDPERNWKYDIQNCQKMQCECELS